MCGLSSCFCFLGVFFVFLALLKGPFKDFLYFCSRLLRQIQGVLPRLEDFQHHLWSTFSILDDFEGHLWNTDLVGCGTKPTKAVGCVPHHGLVFSKRTVLMCVH